jgi:uncharacterized membrane protein
MTAILYVYAIALTVFLAIDALWLTTLGRALYMAEIGQLIRDQPNFVAALVFYVLFVIGLMYFVIMPALTQPHLSRTIFSAALFGIVCYATYDLTNLATLKGFTLRMAIIDILWGGFLATSVTLLTVQIANYFQIKV